MFASSNIRTEADRRQIIKKNKIKHCYEFKNWENVCISKYILISLLQDPEDADADSLRFVFYKKNFVAIYLEANPNSFSVEWSRFCIQANATHARLMEGMCIA